MRYICSTKLYNCQGIYPTPNRGWALPFDRSTPRDGSIGTSLRSASLALPPSWSAQADHPRVCRPRAGSFLCFPISTALCLQSRKMDHGGPGGIPETKRRERPFDPALSLLRASPRQLRVLRVKYLQSHPTPRPRSDRAAIDNKADIGLRAGKLVNGRAPCLRGAKPHAPNHDGREEQGLPGHNRTAGGTSSSSDTPLDSHLGTPP